jgi:hypothetical protein
MDALLLKLTFDDLVSKSMSHDILRLLSPPWHVAVPITGTDKTCVPFVLKSKAPSLISACVWLCLLGKNC